MVIWQTMIWCYEHADKGISTDNINWDFPRFLKIAQHNQQEGELQLACDVTDSTCGPVCITLVLQNEL